MMNDDMLRNIEYLREKADVSYEQAAELLTKFDGNVMRVLVELERQGRVYPQGNPNTGWQAPEYQHTCERHHHNTKNAKKQASNLVSMALQHRLVVESGKGDKKKTIANLSTPFCAVAAAFAPHVAVPTVGLMFLLGYRVRLEKQAYGPMPEDVEDFVDKTVSNIKKTASSITETVRGERPAQTKNHFDDDDDDGDGEITIE